MATKVEKLAAEGDAEAQCSLAFTYEVGLDRDVDMEAAFHWWKKAAKQGHPIAIDKVGQLEAKSSTEPTSQKAPEAKNKAATKTGTIRSKVLLVEDEKELNEIITEELEAEGYNVISVTDGESALNKLLANPDIKMIITDLQMPKMNGMQFIKTIRRMQVAETAALIVMTAYSKPELIQAGQKLEVSQWLAKPFEVESLVKTVNELVAKRSRVA